MPTYAHTVIAGVTDTYEHPIGFLYSKASDVEVFIDDVLIVQGSGAAEYIFSSAGTKITFTDPNEPQTGETLEIRRRTDISTAVVTFASGGGATKSDLNAAVFQLLRALDELQFPAFEVTLTLAAMNAGDITTRTNLDDIPTRIEIWWECTSTDLNYSTGTFVNNADLATPLTPRWTSTSVGFVITDSGQSDNVTFPDISGGAEAAPDETKWSVHIKAWR